MDHAYGMGKVKSYGFDVSNNNGTVDWSRIPTLYRSFAAMKATQGDYFQDGQFPTNWWQAKQQNIPRFAYHYYIPEIAGMVQGEYLHAYVHAHGQFRYGDAVLLDVEAVTTVPTRRYVSELENFVHYVWREIDKPVMLYSSPGYWSGLENPRSRVLEQCPLWIADYGVNKPATLPGWNSPAFWQFTETGNLAGVSGDCDLDLFYGNRDQLHKIMTVVPQP